MSFKNPMDIFKPSKRSKNRSTQSRIENVLGLSQTRVDISLQKSILDSWSICLVCLACLNITVANITETYKYHSSGKKQRGTLWAERGYLVFNKKELINVVPNAFDAVGHRQD